MKKLFVLVVVALLASAAAPSNADAWRGHGRVFVGTHVFVGGPFWGGCCWGGPWWGPGWGWDPFWYPPYYSYAPPVVIQQQPLAYTQQQAQPAQPAPQAQQAYYWYYCADAKAYYPYVQQCPAGWLKVVPQTAPPGQ